MFGNRHGMRGTEQSQTFYWIFKVGINLGLGNQVGVLNMLSFIHLHIAVLLGQQIKIP